MVLGNEACDLDSMVSALVLAYFLAKVSLWMCCSGFRSHQGALGLPLDPLAAPLPHLLMHLQRLLPEVLLPSGHGISSEFHVAELKRGAGRRLASLCRIQTTGVVVVVVPGG